MGSMPARIMPSKGGKPDKLIRDALMVAVNRVDPVEKQKKLNIIASKLVEKACQGDVMAIREISDRIDGKPAQQVDLGNAGDSPIRFEVTWKD